MRARYSRNQGYTISSSRRTARPTVRTVQRKLTFGPTTAKYMGLAVLAILAVIMLTRTSADSAIVYKTASLTKAISDTQSHIDELKVEAERERSVSAIQDTAVKDQMQPMGSADYVDKGEVAGVATVAP